jgi:hypothetical protein
MGRSGSASALTPERGTVGGAGGEKQDEYKTLQSRRGGDNRSARLGHVRTRLRRCQQFTSGIIHMISVDSRKTERGLSEAVI